MEQKTTTIPVIVCANCGSQDIQIKAWVKCNGSQYVSEAYVDSSDTWCPHCEDHTDTMEENEYKQEDEV